MHHLARVERFRGGNPLHLRDDEPAGIPRRHGDRQIVEGQRLALHGDVAGGIGGRAAQQRDLNRKRLVAQPLLAADLDQFHQIFVRALVEFAAAETRIDEGAHPDLGHKARAARGNIAEEMRDDAERQIVGFDLLVERKVAQFRHERPMSADDAFDETFAREAIEAALLAVARRRREHQRQVLRRAGRLEAAQQRQDQLVRRADPDKARECDRVAVAHHRKRFIGGDDLVLESDGHASVALAPTNRRCRSRAAPAPCRRRTRRHGRRASRARNNRMSRLCSPAPARSPAE